MKNLSFLFPALALLATSSWAQAQQFVVRSADDDSRTYSGELGEPFDDFLLGITVQHASFSALDEPGEYYLEVPDVGRSVNFRIANDVYDGELRNAMLSLYAWRSGIDIEFEWHGIEFKHAAGHLNDGLLDYIDNQRGVHKDGVGGWYDAGDYGKYLPTAASAVCAVLTAWELFQDCDVQRPGGMKGRSVSQSPSTWT
jgi:endoglucanase